MSRWDILQGAIDSTGAGTLDGFCRSGEFVVWGRFAFLLFLLSASNAVKAATYIIDLNDVAPIADVPGDISVLVYGPEYFFEAQPGDTFDFGSLTSEPQSAGTRYLPPGEEYVYWVQPEISSNYIYSVATDGGCISPNDFCQLVPHTYSLNFTATGNFFLAWAGITTYTPPSDFTAAVPEVSSWMMLVFGFAGITLLRQRKQFKAQPETLAQRI